MIKVGDSLPSMKLTAATLDGPKEVSTDEVFGGKKVVLFAVPGAFTPTCSARHLPGYAENLEALKSKGVDTIACIAVNDAFVLSAWAKEQHVDGRILMLADGSAVCWPGYAVCSFVWRRRRCADPELSTLSSEPCC